VNRTDEVPDELALIQSERISTQWTNELRKNIRVYPTCNILKAILSLDLYMQTVVYEFLIKGWSSNRIAEHLDASLDLVQILNLVPIWQAIDSVSPRTTESACRPFFEICTRTDRTRVPAQGCFEQTLARLGGPSGQLGVSSSAL
jgi:hypothetical protein